MKLEGIMERKIRSCIRKEGLANSFDIIMEPPLTKEIMVYPNNGKLKPLPINPYNGTKDPVDHVQTFQSHMLHMGTHDAIMCRDFPSTFRLVAQGCMRP